MVIVFIFNNTSFPATVKTWRSQEAIDKPVSKYQLGLSSITQSQQPVLACYLVFIMIPVPFTKFGFRSRKMSSSVDMIDGTLSC